MRRKDVRFEKIPVLEMEIRRNEKRKQNEKVSASFFDGKTEENNGRDGS